MASTWLKRRSKVMSVNGWMPRSYRETCEAE
jgi:hypothetical protein